MFSITNENATLLAHNDSILEALQLLLICTRPHIVGLSRGYVLGNRHITGKKEEEIMEADGVNGSFRNKLVKRRLTSPGREQMERGE